ncbi:hypothetical protein SUDANB106_05074 [Streptomyces sp. enrichment culture]
MDDVASLGLTEVLQVPVGLAAEHGRTKVPYVRKVVRSRYSDCFAKPALLSQVVKSGQLFSRFTGLP